MGYWSKNQPENIVLPWIRKYGWTDFNVLFCLAALIFRHRQNFSPRGLVFHDRLDTLDRRPGPKSLRRAGLSGRFWIWVSSAAGGAHRFLCISWHRLTLFARGFVSMHVKFVFDTMHGKLDRFLENQRNRFCGEHTTFQLSIFNSREIGRGYEDFDYFQWSKMPSL